MVKKRTHTKPTSSPSPPSKKAKVTVHDDPEPVDGEDSNEQVPAGSNEEVPAGSNEEVPADAANDKLEDPSGERVAD